MWQQDIKYTNKLQNIKHSHNLSGHLKNWSVEKLYTCKKGSIK